MGFTKKSLLALVLALVMVLGMAVPTAFAGYGVAIDTTLWDGAAATLNGATVVMSVDSKPVEIKAYNGSHGGGGVPTDFLLTDANLGAKPVVTFTNLNTNVATVSFNDGVFTITPTGKAIYANMLVGFEIAPPATGFPGAVGGLPTTGFDDCWYEGELDITVNPIASYTPASVLLDSGVQAASGKAVTPADFTTIPAGAEVVIDSPSVWVGNVTTVDFGTPGTKGYSFEIKANPNAVGSDLVTVPLTVGGVPLAADIEIPVSVGNSANPAYAIGVSKDSFTEKTNVNLDNLKFDVFAVDKSGNKVADSTVTNISIDPFVPEGGATANVFTTTPTATETANKVAITLADDVVKAKGYFVVNGTADVGPAGSIVTVALMPKIVRLNVLPLTITADAGTVVFEKNLENPSLTKYVYYSTSEVGTLTGTNYTNLPVNTITLGTPETVQARIKDTLTATTSALVQSDKVTVEGTIAITSSNVTAATRTGIFTTDAREVNLQVKDSTRKPVLTPSATSVTLDVKSGSTTSSTDVMLTPSNFFKYGGYTSNNATIALDAINLTTSFVPDATGKVTVTPANNTPTDTTAKITITGTAKYTGVLTLKGTINGLPFADVKINVKIDDTTPGKPHSIASSLTSITAYQNTQSMKFTMDVKDATGATLAVNTINPSSIDFVTKDDGSDTPVASTVPLTIVPFAVSGGLPTSNQWEARFGVAAVGKGFVKIVAATTAAPIGECVLYIPYEVKAQELTVTPTDLKFDLADPNKIEATITVTANGNISDISTPSAAGLTFTPDAVANVATSKTWKYKVTATAPQKASTFKLTGGKIDGFNAAETTISYEVLSSYAIRAKDVANNDVTKLAFSMEAGGAKDSTLTMNPFPATMGATTCTIKVDSVVSSDPAVVSVTDLKTTPIPSYQFIALKDGTGAITVKGTVTGINGIVSDPITLVIPFTVGASEAPKLTVSPASPILLSTTDASKKEATLTFSSTAGKVEDVAIAVAPAGIVQVSTTEPWKVTALAKGEAKLTVNAKVAGEACEPLVITVAVDQAVSDGNFLVNDVAATPTSLLSRNSVANNQYKLTLAGFTGKVTWKTGNNSILKLINPPAGAKATKTKVGTEVQWVQVLKTGKVKITATPAGGVAKSITFTIKNEAETGFIFPTVPADGTLRLLVGQRASVKAQVQPATAKSKGYTYSSSAKSIVTVSKNGGTLLAKKAGEATIKINPKKAGLANQYVKVIVTVDYKALNFNSVVVLQDIAGKANANAADVKAIFDSARFDGAATPKAANVLPAAATKADVKAAIAQMVTASVNTYDINNFYFAGTATKTGLSFSDGEYTYGELAADLAKCTGNVVVYLDATGANRMLNTKAVTDADVFAAFSKATKSGLSQVASRDRVSFTVFTATKKAKTSVTPDTNGSWAFTKTFVDALKADTTGKVAAAGTDNFVTVKEMWAKLKAAKGAVWKSNSSALPIYGAVPATPVTTP